MKKVVVTGCAGFIGSTLVDRLLSDGYEVHGIDNFSTGQKSFLKSASRNKNFTLHEHDLLHPDTYKHVFKNTEIVFHLAANADVRFGLQRRRIDLEQNTICTFNILECMTEYRVRTIVFSSTGSVYGEAEQIPTPENANFPVQTSLYGASKLACEGLISAYAEGLDIDALIFRFVSILGPRYTHGHVVDFTAQLIKDPTKLFVLGNGTQRKSYLHVYDCVSAMMLALSTLKQGSGAQIFNLGADEYCTVNQSISWICQRLGVMPILNYSGGDRGWVGDNPFIFLDTDKIKSLGWQARHSIKEGVQITVDYLKQHDWILDKAS